MKKSFNKKKLLRYILLVFIIVILVDVLISELTPLSAAESYGKNEFVNREQLYGTDFQSEDLEINGKKYFIYTTLDNSASNGEKNQFVITVGEVTGIRNNRYTIKSFEPQETENCLSNEYINVYDSPQYEIKKGSKYFGSIYVGTVPIDCKSVTIQGKQATLVEQSFNLNGNNADFYLYYCAVSENTYPDSVSVVCEKEDGSKINIETEKY